jgi:Fuc2NAc and GlcNAc transferase
LSEQRLAVIPKHRGSIFCRHISDKGYHLAILTANLRAASPTEIELSNLIVFIFFIASCGLTTVGLAIFLRLQPRLGLLDVPNERSSHTEPVPRGGGVVVVAVSLTFYFFATAYLNVAVNWGFVIAGSIIAAVSLLDDIWSIPLVPRLIVHVTAAVIFVSQNGVFTDLGDSGFQAGFGQLGTVISVLFIVWMINAYNFMDGIDGILGIQGVSAGLAWGLFGLFAGWQIVSLVGGVLAGSCLAFLFFNWQPAKIFMGDVGSTFLGFCFAVIAFLSTEVRESGTSLGFFPAILFSFLFLFDTLFTRIRLVVRGNKFWRPHREHLYQRLVRSGIQHRSVAEYFGAGGLVISILGILGTLRDHRFLLLSGLAALLSAVVLLLWARKKYIDLNIG